MEIEVWLKGENDDETKGVKCVEVSGWSEKVSGVRFDKSIWCKVA